MISVGDVSAPVTLSIANDGGSATTAIGVSLSGADAASFLLVAGANGCEGTILQPADTCTRAIEFAPTSSGAKSATLAAGAAQGGIAIAALSGVGAL